MKKIHELPEQLRPRAQYQLLIDGQWRDGATGKTFVSTSPATDEPLSVFAWADASPFGGYKKSGIERNRSTIDEGSEDVSIIRMDSMVVETNIHYAGTFSTFVKYLFDG